MKLGYQVHRPRTVQRDQRDDVLEAVGPRVGGACDACRATRTGTRRPSRRGREAGRYTSGSSSGKAVEYRARLIDAVAARRRCAPSPSSRVSVSVRQAEEVELHEPRRSRRRPCRTGDTHAGEPSAARRAVQKVRELARRDEHAARVHADVAGQALELARRATSNSRTSLPALALGELRGVGFPARSASVSELCDRG